ncbi:uncharacterized protein [Panulirus ornatus]|uniref:uncharacterized protein n=1 Tax=Panulirus ornatus TaxID=150431 RepID=UPI003A880382
MAVLEQCFPVATMVALAVLLQKFAGGEEACGCWGSNKVYVQHKAPATGWYTSLSDKFIYERNVKIFGDDIQYLLEYKPRSKYWALFERRVKQTNHPRGETLLLSNRKVKKIIILCPTRCSCQNVFVQGTACWVINGNYIRSDILKKQNSTSNLSPSTWSSSQSDKFFDLTTGKQGNTDVNVSETNVTNPKLTENSLNKIKGMSILEQSNCLLAKLAECIDSQDNVNSKSSDDQEENGGKDDGCQQYISVLANSTWQDSGMDTDHTINSTAKYILEGKKKDYILTQDEDGNFWWIVDQNEVYAVSDEAGPCPDQLPSSKWTSVDESHRNAKISVTCTDRDTPEGD